MSVSRNSKLTNNSSTKFKVIIPSYNSEKWISKTLSSVASQYYVNYDVTIIDDCSTDINQKNIIKSYCEKYNSKFSKWKCMYNKTRMFALYNIYNGIYCSSCKNNDVILILDGDDWLHDNNVFNKLNNYYLNNDIYMTYGQYINYPSNDIGHCKEFSKDIIENNLYRQSYWRFSHLKTFKFELFRQIKKEDLLDIDGKFMKFTYDLAIMFPIAEMANGKFKFINDILYVYNDSNPINVNKTKREEQARICEVIRNKKVYDKYIK